MSQLPVADRPPDTFELRARFRVVWLALWLAGAAGCVAEGIYDGTPETPHEWWWLPLFLLLAAVSVVLGVRSFGNGLDIDGKGVIVRNTLHARPIPWRELAAIEFKGVSSAAITNMYYKMVFRRHDGTRVTAEAPVGGARAGEDLFQLRERLLAIRDAALGDPHPPADRPPDAARTDEEAHSPAEPPSWVLPPWSGSTDTENAPPSMAAQSQVNRRREIVGVVGGVAVLLAIVFVQLMLPDLLLGDKEAGAADSPVDTTESPADTTDGQSVYWEDLRTGMCIRDIVYPSEDPIVVNCGVKHEEEVMSRSTLAGIKPGDAALEDTAGEKCKSAFESYVGLKLADSRLDLDFLTPDKEDWNHGKVTLICFVIDPDNDRITRSLRGAHE